MAKVLAAAGLLTSLSGCPLLPPVDSSVTPAIPCTIGAPPLGQTDQLSAPMARWTLTVIKSGQALCGWKAPK
jgi:hypothetical protein